MHIISFFNSTWISFPMISFPNLVKDSLLLKDLLLVNLLSYFLKFPFPFPRLKRVLPL